MEKISDFRQNSARMDGVPLNFCFEMMVLKMLTYDFYYIPLSPQTCLCNLWTSPMANFPYKFSIIDTLRVQICVDNFLFDLVMIVIIYICSYLSDQTIYVFQIEMHFFLITATSKFTLRIN